MTTLPLYQVDAFTDQMFSGNPAAVVPLDAWLPDNVLQSIAAENNLAETAFIVPREGESDTWHLRWFTPRVEVPLCGHATLATAHVLWSARGVSAGELHFDTLSGRLSVRSAGDAYDMDFPADPPREIGMLGGLSEALGAQPKTVLAGQYLMAVMPDRTTVEALAPDFAALGRLKAPGRDGPAEMCVIATAQGEDALDFVSRFFAPSVGIDEDPVTGSAHALLAPYWAARLGKTNLSARQVSSRGGDIHCAVKGERVILRGQCVTYLAGEIMLPDASAATR